MRATRWRSSQSSSGATASSPAVRATVMALTIMAIQVGRAIASQIGVAVLNASSLYVNAVLAGLLALLGVAIAWRYIHEAERHAAHDAV